MLVAFTRIALVCTLLVFSTTAFAQVQEDWSVTYVGEGANEDEPVGIGLDNALDCYVAGRSYSSLTSWDFVVAKYHDGLIDWERRYNGVGDTMDYAYTMAVAGDGHIYISGYAKGGGGSGQDFLTVAYKPDGDTAWTSRVDLGASDFSRHIKVLGDGSLIIAGKGYSPVSFALIKYTADGDTAWARRYAWTGATTHNGQRVACDSSGNLIVTGTARNNNQEDVLTVKFSPDGDTLWGRIYNGTAANSFDEGRAVAADRDGNVYVAAKVLNTSPNSDIAVLKYSPNGALLWERAYDGSAASLDEPWDMLLTRDGNVCVAGVSYGSGSSGDFMVLKYSPTGDTVWQTRAPGSDYEEAVAMAQDTAGNIYVVGRRYVTAGCSDDYLVMKFDGVTGAVLWEKSYDENCGSNRGLAIAVAGADQVYVTGTSDPSGEPDGGIDIRTVKYEPVASAVFESASPNVPRAFALRQNVPNPFNSSTTIDFDLASGGDVELAIYNVLGQCVLSHAERDLSPSAYSFTWNGTDERGAALPSGIYLYRLASGRSSESRKMTLLK